MDHHKLVLPEHLNHYGFLFGGHLLHWTDEVAYITATIDYPACEFVTVAMDNVAFKKSIANGEVLRFNVNVLEQGKTSVSYGIKVYGETRLSTPDVVLFETSISFVCVDKKGRPKNIETHK